MPEVASVMLTSPDSLHGRGGFLQPHESQSHQTTPHDGLKLDAEAQDGAEMPGRFQQPAAVVSPEQRLDPGCCVMHPVQQSARPPPVRLDNDRRVYVEPQRVYPAARLDAEAGPSGFPNSRPQHAEPPAGRPASHQGLDPR